MKIRRFNEKIEHNVQNILNIASDEGFPVRIFNQDNVIFFGGLDLGFDRAENDKVVGLEILRNLLPEKTYTEIIKNKDSASFAFNISQATELQELFDISIDDREFFLNICKDVKRRLDADGDYHYVMYSINNEGTFEVKPIKDGFLENYDLNMVPYQIQAYRLPMITSIRNRGNDTILFEYDGSDQIKMYGGQYFRISPDEDNENNFYFVDPSGGPFVQVTQSIQKHAARFPEGVIDNITRGEDCYIIHLKRT